MKEIAGIKLYSITELCSLMDCKRPTIYKLITKGKLGATKIGRNYMVSEENLKKYLNGQF